MAPTPAARRKSKKTTRIFPTVPSASRFPSTPKGRSRGLTSIRAASVTTRSTTCTKSPIVPRKSSRSSLITTIPTMPISSGSILRSRPALHSAGSAAVRFPAKWNWTTSSIRTQIRSICFSCPTERWAFLKRRPPTMSMIWAS